MDTPVRTALGIHTLGAVEKTILLIVDFDIQKEVREVNANIRFGLGIIDIDVERYVHSIIYAALNCEVKND